MVFDWVLPLSVVLGAVYGIPSAICYWEYKVNAETSLVSGMCFIPGINIIIALCCIEGIWEHYFPTPIDPDYISPHEAMRQIVRDLDSGKAAKDQRRPKYATEFIKQHHLSIDFEDFCDAMELARELQKK